MLGEILRHPWWESNSVSSVKTQRVERATYLLGNTSAVWLYPSRSRRFLSTWWDELRDWPIPVVRWEIEQNTCQSRGLLSIHLLRRPIPCLRYKSAMRAPHRNALIGSQVLTSTYSPCAPSVRFTPKDWCKSTKWQVFSSWRRASFHQSLLYHQLKTFHISLKHFTTSPGIVR
jgi:hypothetical protein